jgi:hypothetical protein
MIVTDILGDGGGYENITPEDTATGIDPAQYQKVIHGVEMSAIGALLTCEDETVHITFHGTDPTAASGTNIGHPLAAGNSYVVRSGPNVRNFRCIDAVSGAKGTVKATVFF